MSYQVIARKWRPKNFEELVGQHHVSQTLINALRADRMPHALLFTGPRGTGKTSTARILAKSLRCPKAKDFIPCDNCPECQDISVGRSVDVVEIDGASNNGVDAIRELRDAVGYMPSSGRFKIYIIDEVHMLSGSAFNALLKTLEEPPDHVIFVMATTEVQKIPTTILSRCQRFDFRRIPLRMIADHLKEICKTEKVKAETEALWLLARQGDGSMRDSQSLLEQVISFTESDLTAAKVTEVLGLTDRVLLLKTLRSLVERDAKNILEVINGLYQSGHDPSLFMRDLLEELRHLLLVKVTDAKAPEAVDLSLEEIQNLRELGESLSEEDIHLLFDMALKGAQDILRSQDSRVVLEMLLLRMGTAPRVQDIARMMQNSRAYVDNAVSPNIHGGAPSKPSATPKNQQSNTNKAADTHKTTGSNANGPEQQWLAFVTQVKSVNSVIGAKLDHLKLVEITDKLVQIAIPEKFKFLADQVKTDDFLKKISNYLNTFWGKKLKVEVVDAGHVPKPHAATARDLAKENSELAEKELRAEIEKHPLVQSISSHFNVEMKSIKERS